MDVNFTSLPSLQPQSGGQSGNSQATGSATTAVKTLQTNPDSVVRQSSQPAGSQNDSGRGLAREEPRELKSAQQALDSLRFSSRKTQVGFDNELNRVFIEVVDTRTDQVVEQIGALSEQIGAVAGDLVRRGRLDRHAHRGQPPHSSRHRPKRGDRSSAGRSLTPG